MSKEPRGPVFRFPMDLKEQLIDTSARAEELRKVALQRPAQEKRANWAERWAAILLQPLALFGIGWFANSTLKGMEVDAQYVKLAVGILADEGQQEPLLLEWATHLVNDLSPRKLGQDLSEALRTGQLNFKGTYRPALSFEHGAGQMIPLRVEVISEYEGVFLIDVYTDGALTWPSRFFVYPLRWGGFECLDRETREVYPVGIEVLGGVDVLSFCFPREHHPNPHTSIVGQVHLVLRGAEGWELPGAMSPGLACD